MSVLKKIFSESLTSSYFELWNNKLRTSLSLLGIVIGIVCIISVAKLIRFFKLTIFFLKIYGMTAIAASFAENQDL